MNHASHKSQLPRLRRIQGQATGLIRMVEEERYCADILTQVRALQGALRRVEHEILKAHIEHCVAGAVAGGDHAARQSKLDELNDILRRFGV
ncbi:MAG TPA: metal-sensitive transcriptional regulator [Gammaproteobacteria bacterium]|jgi:DNA-binding FrmR family transcriptional regulator|nr:metal-sensitive transcriptional regulator [Gammaproteobacteria bacterium]